MPRQSSRSLGCAGDRPSAAPSAVQARQPLPQTLPLRSRAGWTARLRWGGAGLSAASPRLRVPHPRLAPRSGQRVLLFGRSGVEGFGDAPRTTPALHRGRLRFRSFLPPAHPATVLRPPKVSRTESHRHASRPLVPRSRAACRRLTVRVWLDRRLNGNAPAVAFARKPGGGELRPPAPAKLAPTAPLRSGGCHGFCLLPRPERSVRRPTRPVKRRACVCRRRQCLRASGGSSLPGG